MTISDNVGPGKALKLRERVKAKKPKFVRAESWRYVRLKENWRNPRGLDHKVRLMYKGWPPAPGSGFGGPKSSRGLHPSGYREVLVQNAGQLSKIDPENQAVRIGHRVGKKKRASILAEARRKKVVVLNLRQTKETREEKVAEEGIESKTEETPHEAKQIEGKTEVESKQSEVKGEKRKRKSEKH